MTADIPAAAEIRRIRRLLALFVLGLVFSGLTAFPLTAEVAWLRGLAGEGTGAGAALPLLSVWIERVHLALQETSQRHAFLFYGTDWLAFAHIVIAVAFWGPYRDPVRNRWVIRFGLVACVLVVPFAVVSGGLRGIPPFWRLIDSCFGVLGFVPLWLADRAAGRLAGREGPP